MRNKLDIIITGSNDDYHADYLYRTAFSLNFNLTELNKLDYFDLTKIIFVDWAFGDNKRLDQVLNINKEFKDKVNFIRVEGKDAEELTNTKYIDVTKSVNIGIRRSSAENVLLVASDLLFTKRSWSNLFEYFNENNRENKTFIIRRTFIPLDLWNKNPSFSDVNFWIEHGRAHPTIVSSSWGDAGGFGSCRELLVDKIKGMTEQGPFWGGNDTEIFLTSLQYALPFDLTLNKGVLCHKIPYHRLGRRNDSIAKDLIDWEKTGFRNRDFGYPLKEFKTFISEKNNFSLTLNPNLNYHKKLDFKFFLIRGISITSRSENIGDINFSLVGARYLRKLKPQNIIVYGDFYFTVLLSMALADRSINIFWQTTNKVKREDVIRYLHKHNGFTRFVSRNDPHTGANLTFIGKVMISMNEEVLNHIKKTNSIILINYSDYNINREHFKNAFNFLFKNGDSNKILIKDKSSFYFLESKSQILKFLNLNLDLNNLTSIKSSFWISYFIFVVSKCSLLIGAFLNKTKAFIRSHLQ